MKLGRAVLMLVVMAMTLGPLVACEEEPGGIAFDQRRLAGYAATTGEALTIPIYSYEHEDTGCACDPGEKRFTLGASGVTYALEPADGATMASDGTFVATRPGKYTVLATSEDGATAKTTVTVTGEQLPEEEGPPSAESTATETAEVDPWVGTWMWTAWWAGQKPGAKGTLKPDEFEWKQSSPPVDLVLTKSDSGYTAGGWILPGTTVEVSGSSIRVMMSSEGGSVVLEGTL